MKRLKCSVKELAALASLDGSVSPRECFSHLGFLHYFSRQSYNLELLLVLLELLVALLELLLVLQEQLLALLELLLVQLELVSFFSRLKKVAVHAQHLCVIFTHKLEGNIPG